MYVQNRCSLRVFRKGRNLDSITVLRGGLKQGHDIAEQAMTGLTPEQLHRKIDDATIESIATIYVHTVMSEDYLMNSKVRNQDLLFDRDGWADKTGISMIPFGGDYAGWVASLPQADYAALRDYAEQVYNESDETLSGLDEADLDRIVNFIDDRPLGQFLTNVVVWHAVHHGGELCALKGVMGSKGLPF